MTSKTGLLLIEEFTSPEIMSRTSNTRKNRMNCARRVPRLLSESIPKFTERSATVVSDSLESFRLARTAAGATISPFPDSNYTAKFALANGPDQ